jgi:hypothetical protein
MMKFTGSLLMITLLCVGIALAQPAPAVDLPLVVTNGPVSRTLHFGLAPSATDGQDLLMDETELPPPPPAGAFDVRFATLDPAAGLQGQWKDYRSGSISTAASSLFRLKFQPGEGTSTITFAYALPKGVTGRFVDRMGGLLVDHPVLGSGNFTLDRLTLNELDMEIFWNGNPQATDQIAPSSYALDQSYPNPFNPATTIHYAVPSAGPVTLRVFDVTGREVATLDEGMRQPGRYAVTWDASNLAGGVYFYRLSAAGFMETRSMVLLK